MEENSLNANNIHASDNITDNLVVLSTSARTIENETGIKGPIFATPQQIHGNYIYNEGENKPIKLGST